MWGAIYDAVYTYLRVLTAGHTQLKFTSASSGVRWHGITVWCMVVLLAWHANRGTNTKWTRPLNRNWTQSCARSVSISFLCVRVPVCVMSAAQSCSIPSCYQVISLTKRYSNGHSSSWNQQPMLNTKCENRLPFQRHSSRTAWSFKCLQIVAHKLSFRNAIATATRLAFPSWITTTMTSNNLIASAVTDEHWPHKRAFASPNIQL